MSAARDLRRMVNGYQLAQALHVAAVLELSDVLAGGARTAGELAEIVGADADALERLVRADASAVTSSPACRPAATSICSRRSSTTGPVAILRGVRDALPDDGTVLLVEAIPTHTDVFVIEAVPAGSEVV